MKIEIVQIPTLTNDDVVQTVFLIIIFLLLQQRRTGKCADLPNNRASFDALSGNMQPDALCNSSLN